MTMVRGTSFMSLTWPQASWKPASGPSAMSFTSCGSRQMATGLRRASAAPPACACGVSQTASNRSRWPIRNIRAPFTGLCIQPGWNLGDHVRRPDAAALPTQTLRRFFRQPHRQDTGRQCRTCWYRIFTGWQPWPSVTLTAPTVTLRDGHTLAPDPGGNPDASFATSGDFTRVAWSADGKMLFSGGRYYDGEKWPVIAWPSAAMARRCNSAAWATASMTWSHCRKAASSWAEADRISPLSMPISHRA